MFGQIILAEHRFIRQHQMSPSMQNIDRALSIRWTPGCYFRLHCYTVFLLTRLANLMKIMVNNKPLYRTIASESRSFHAQSLIRAST